MRAVILFAVGTLLMSCMSGGSSDPDATAIDSFSGYTGWHRVNTSPITGDTTGALGNVHEGSSGFREVYINSVGSAASAPLPHPEGTMVVKESFKNDAGEKGKLTGITVMSKREAGYDPENGDWEYLNVKPNLKVSAQGRLSLCVSCHSASDNDYVFTSSR